jgi:hypothetical protein
LCSWIFANYFNASGYKLFWLNLAGLFRISPIVGLKNCFTRLQEGKVVSMGN